VDTVIQTDGRNPGAKHAILEAYVRHGLELPDAPTMALHRGRIDLLEAHLWRDPTILTRTFSHREIYPAEMGCGDPIDAVTGTPLERGANPNIRASIWKRLSHGHDTTMVRHDYRDVTPLSWGRRFHARIFVSEPAMQLIAAAGGVE
jgi:hypothetical protein